MHSAVMCTYVRQGHRTNIEVTVEDYYPNSIHLRYMDSLIQSLNIRFDESYTPFFSIFALHIQEMQKIGRDEFKNIISSVKQMHGTGGVKIFSILQLHG